MKSINGIDLLSFLNRFLSQLPIQREPPIPYPEPSPEPEPEPEPEPQPQPESKPEKGKK